MVIKHRNDSLASEVKWVGSRSLNTFVPQLANKNVFFYTKCILGSMTLSIGDFVLVSNVDLADPEDIEMCDIARILNLYEDQDNNFRAAAIVQWYSRPKAIPHKVFDDDNICIDLEKEIIEEHRPFDNDVSLECIFRKCNVILGTFEDSTADLLNTFNKNNNLLMFVCRYKFIKIKKSYRLIPLESENDSSQLATNVTKQETSNRNSATLDENPKVRSSSARKAKQVAPIEKRKRRASVAAFSEVEFVDVNNIPTMNKVSPIKIIGGCNVVRLSSSTKKSITPSSKKNKTNTINDVLSPLVEHNKDLTPNSRIATARRNLNLSLDNDPDSSKDSNYLNYSIVKNTIEETETPNNDIKIKLRVSQRRQSIRLSSTDNKNPLDHSNQRKRVSGIGENSVPNINDIYNTPTKKLRNLAESEEGVLSTRRKSILKSTSNRITDGTPRRSIQLSNIVEKRIFQDDDIIVTPKSNHQKVCATRSDIEKNVTPKKSKSKLVTTRRLINQADLEENNINKEQVRSKINPGVKVRTPSSNGKKVIKSDLQWARELLHVSAVPKSLPCREKEFNDIYTFLEGKILDHCSGCMYVSGVPGTGKTATVSGAIRMLQHMATKNKLDHFEFIEINGMRLTEPRQAYIQIYKQLTGKSSSSWEHAYSLLDKRFTTPAPHRSTTVLLVDELDILCNRRQDVVYNLLDWPTKSAAHLVVVTIANTMDLPERLLMGKVTSRLGLTRLTFQPYSHKQLQEIVTTRLSGSNAFKDEAVQLVARKVAAVSGDARRALDICRRATEIADLANLNASIKEKCVNMIHVQQALSEMIASAKVQAIKNCSLIEQIFLQAIVAEVQRTGVEETSFMGVFSQIKTIAAFTDRSVNINPSRALTICSKLGSQRLIICEHSRNDLFQKILLNVSADDIHYALRVNTNI